MVASPSAYDPVQHPVAARKRRDLVLLRLFEQGYLTQPLYDEAKAQDLPTRDLLSFPEEDTDYPYFTSWIKQQVVDQLGGGQEGAQRAFEGGLRVKTTIDSRLQKSADDAIKAWLPNLVRPARLARRHLQQGRDGPGDGRRRQLLHDAVQPRHAGPAPAGLGVQAVRARRGAAPERQPRVDVGVGEADVHPQGRRALHGEQLRGRVRGRDDAGQRDDVLRQLRLRRRSRGRSSRATSPSSRAGMGIRTPVSTNLRDVARRPAPGRHAAGHGARVRDVRDRRPAGLRDALARAEREASAGARPGRASSGSTRCAATRRAPSSSRTGAR